MDGRRRYTGEEHDFLRETIPGRSHEETRAAFEARFGRDVTTANVKGYAARHRIRNGFSGRFEKGHVSHNKGRKGTCAPGCEKGWFKKGRASQNHMPVGSERVSKDGYVEVKVAEPGKWRYKHRVEWEREFGAVPKGKCLTFLNGDKLDARTDNLALIDLATNARLNRSGLRSGDPDCTRAAISLAALASAMAGARAKTKKGKGGSG